MKMDDHSEFSKLQLSADISLYLDAIVHCYSYL
jgi:hypothetical protein